MQNCEVLHGCFGLKLSTSQNVFPVEYGPDFDTALETLVCEFFTRLEGLLPIPDFKQAKTTHAIKLAVYISFFQRLVVVCIQFVKIIVLFV